MSRSTTMAQSHSTIDDNRSEIVYPPSDEEESEKQEALRFLKAPEPDQLVELASNSDIFEDETVKVYCNRWHILIIYFWLSTLNAFAWISFAPVPDYTATLFNVTASGVNWLSLSFLVAYTPGSVLASLFLVKNGLRSCVLIGALFMAIGCWMRYMSVILFPVASANFSLLLAGQFVVALVQPFFLNIVSKVSGEWFPKKEREIATVIASLAQIAGNAAGQVIPSIVCNCNQSIVPCPVDDIVGMDWLLFGQAILSSVLLLWVLAFFRDGPPLPPTATSAARRQEWQDREKSVSASCAALWKENKALLSDGNFLILMMGFGIGLGLFNTVLTLIEQIILPIYYNTSNSTEPESNQAQNDSGMFAGLCIGGGVIGALAVGFLLDATHKFGLILKLGFTCAVISFWVVLLTLRPGNTTLLSVTFGILGFFMMPMLPCVLSSAAEATYPISEEASNGLLMLAGQYWGIIFIFLIQYLMEFRTNWWQPGAFRESVFCPSSLAMGVSLTACLIILFFFKAKTLRLDHEKEKLDKSSLL